MVAAGCICVLGLLMFFGSLIVLGLRLETYYVSPMLTIAGTGLLCIGGSLYIFGHGGVVWVLALGAAILYGIAYSRWQRRVS